MGKALVVACVASVVMFTNLGGPRLWDRDEPRNAGCAREMLQRGDWVTPVFNDELRSHKPVLLYWLIMGAYTVWGESEFAARFFSALLAVGTALCTYVIGWRLFSPTAGMWAAITLSTSLLFGVAGRAATPDSLLIFLSTLAVTIYVLGTYRNPRQRTEQQFTSPCLRVPNRFFPASRSVAVAIYAVMGLGVLAKGPVGLVLPTAVIGMFILMLQLPHHDLGEGRMRFPSLLRAFSPPRFLQACWLMRPITAISVVLLVTFPWHLLVGLRTDGEFLREFFLVHNLERATAPMEEHGGGLLYYPCALLVGFFPWSVLAGPLIIDVVGRLKRGDPWRPGYLLSVCWVGVFVGAFSIAQTKLPSYVTPCFPGLSLALGGFMDHWLRGSVYGSARWRQLALGTLAAIGLTLTVLLPLAITEFLPGDQWLGAIGLVPLVGAVTTWILVERKKERLALTAFATTSTLFIVGLLGVAAARASGHQEIDRMFSVVASRGSDVRLASFGALEPSWVYYGGRPVDELYVDDRFVERDGRWCPKDPQSVSDIVASSEDWLIITTEHQLEWLRTQLTEEFKVLCDVQYFLKDERLVLVGRE